MSSKKPRHYSAAANAAYKKRTATQKKMAVIHEVAKKNNVHVSPAAVEKYSSLKSLPTIRRVVAADASVSKVFHQHTLGTGIAKHSVSAAKARARATKKK